VSATDWHTKGQVRRADLESSLHMHALPFGCGGPRLDGLLTFVTTWWCCRCGCSVWTSCIGWPHDGQRPTSLSGAATSGPGAAAARGSGRTA
jgi:hypothetical protein